jgi:hypothetical protein
MLGQMAEEPRDDSKPGSDVPADHDHAWRCVKDEADYGPHELYVCDICNAEWRL